MEVTEGFGLCVLTTLVRDSDRFGGDIVGWGVVDTGRVGCLFVVDIEEREKEFIDSVRLKEALRLFGTGTAASRAIWEW